MKVTKTETDTYILSELEGLDKVTVYVTNYKPGEGKITIECYGDSWAYYWGSMGLRTLQQFFIVCDNGYLLNKLVSNINETDLEAIAQKAKENGFAIEADHHDGLHFYSEEMTECYGEDWMIRLPIRLTPEARHVDRIIDAIKAAFRQEIKQAA